MTEKCQYCGAAGGHPAICPTVKAIEYFPSGKVKRVEFKCAPDYPQPFAQMQPMRPLTSSPQWPLMPAPPMPTSLPLCGCMSGTACMNVACPYRPQISFSVGSAQGLNS